MRKKELIDGAVEHLRTSASVKNVYGDPIVSEGRTVIPVARVSYEFGGTQTKDKDGKVQPNGEGGDGGGGGVKAKPVGVVEITGEDTKFVRFGQPRNIAIAAALASGVGLGLGWMLARRRSTRSAQR